MSYALNANLLFSRKNRIYNLNIQADCYLMVVNILNLERQFLCMVLVRSLSVLIVNLSAGYVTSCSIYCRYEVRTNLTTFSS